MTQFSCFDSMREPRFRFELRLVFFLESFFNVLTATGFESGVFFFCSHGTINKYEKNTKINATTTTTR